MKTLQVLLKPVSSACDIKCTYCFYRDEAAHRKTENAGYMKREVALAVIEKALEFADTCTFAFQGGEPTLAGLDFYREFVELVNTRKGGNSRYITLFRQMPAVWMKVGLVSLEKIIF